MAKPKKVNLEKEAAQSNAVEEKELITEEFLLEICPKEILAKYKKAKTPAARADFLYAFDKEELKKARDAFKALDNFYNKLEAWFIQGFEGTDATGVTGKVGHVEVKTKTIAVVEDWDKFYGHIAKKKEFDLLNRAVNQKAVNERWEHDKAVPGVGTFNKKTLSLTAAKGKK